MICLCRINFALLRHNYHFSGISDSHGILDGQDNESTFLIKTQAGSERVFVEAQTFSRVSQGIVVLKNLVSPLKKSCKQWKKNYALL